MALVTALPDPGTGGDGLERSDGDFVEIEVVVGKHLAGVTRIGSG